MGWFSNLFSGSNGPGTYYVAWKAKGPPQSPNSSFEYIMHPTTEGGEVHYAALIDALDRNDSWRKVVSLFPDAASQLLELADEGKKHQFEMVKSQAGVKTVVPTSKS
jgi:hypothetical protein